MLNVPALSAQIINPDVTYVDPFTGLEEEVPSRTDDLPCYGYTEPGSTVERWDWRAESFTVWVKPINAPAYSFTAPSPLLKQPGST